MSTMRPRPPTDRVGMQQITICLGTATAALLPGAALAHTQAGIAGGFLSGFTHPIFGFDHVVAMVAVGLWGGVPGATGDLAPAGGVSRGDGVRRPRRRAGRAVARGRDGHRALGGGARRHGGPRAASAALGRCGAGRRLRHLSRSRPRHRAARGGEPAGVRRGLRDRDRAAPPLWHRARAPLALARGPESRARWRRCDRLRRAVFPLGT
jgi:hypothetical protein